MNFSSMMVLLMVIFVQIAFMTIGYGITGGYDGSVLAVLFELLLMFIAIEIMNASEGTVPYNKTEILPVFSKTEIAKLRQELAEMRAKLDDAGK